MESHNAPPRENTKGPPTTDDPTTNDRRPTQTRPEESNHDTAAATTSPWHGKGAHQQTR